MLYRISLFSFVAVLTLPTATAAAQTLDSVAHLAIANNLSIRRAADRERAASADVSAARGKLLPTSGIEARYSKLSGAINIGDFINPAYNALNKLTGTT